MNKAKIASVLHPAKTILNPAPVTDDVAGIRAALLPLADIVTPNQVEALSLAGIRDDEPETAARRIRQMSSGDVIITLGSSRCLIQDNTASCRIPGHGVQVVDTTAAGDAFNGALAVGLARGETLKDAAVAANRVAAVTVTRAGAQSSLPRPGDAALYFGQLR